MLFIEHFFLFELFLRNVAECYLLVSCDAQATTQNIQSYGLMIIVWYLNLNLFQVKCPEYWSMHVHDLWTVSFTVFMYVYVQTLLIISFSSTSSPCMKWVVFLLFIHHTYNIGESKTQNWVFIFSFSCHEN